MMKSFIQVGLVILLVVIIRTLLGLYNYHSGIDDANIYFVYVKNVNAGYGFVYNPGGEHVEGFTSFLWAILLTLIYSIKFLPFETSVLVFSFFITTGTVFLYHKYVKDTYSSFLSWVLVFYILLTPGFIDWNVFTLMDTCLWILASSWATILLLSGKREKLFLLITILLPLVRPEGIALSIILFFLKLFKDYSSIGSFGKALRRNIRLLALICLVIFLLTLFRVLYFGYPFPNTFYAKVSMSITGNVKQAFFYLYDALRHTSFVPFILFLICLFHMLRRDFLSNWRTNINPILLVIIIAFFMGYPFLTGGDHFKYSRFFQPGFPLIGLLFVSLFNNKIIWRKPVAIAGVCLVLLMLNIDSKDETSFRQNWRDAATSYFERLSPDLVSPSQLQSEFNIAVYGRRLADHMNKIMAACDSTPSYGVVAAGGIRYDYKGRTIDLMGLNNTEMAHANKVKSIGVKDHGSFSKKVFYEQDIDVFLTWPDPLTAEIQQNDEAALVFLRNLRDPHYFINRVCDNIFNDPEFNRLYSFCKISNNQEHVYGFIKPESFIQKYPQLQIIKLN